jgi:hypothetical protein
VEFNLGDYLNPDEIRHYERFLGTGTLTAFIHPRADEPWKWTATVVNGAAPARERYQAVAAIQELPTTDAYLIRSGHGPDTASSCQELARFPEIVWDVCGYYKRLGLHWRATKRQIREAVMASRATIGTGDPRLIYAAKQLLSDDVRARYDRVPLGGLFLEDAETEQYLKKAASRAASAMAARGYPQMTPEDVLGSWGFAVTPRGGPEGEGQERLAPSRLPPPRLGAQWAAMVPWVTRWSWYRDLEVYDVLGLRTARLEAWQLLLVREFGARGIRARFAVGLCSLDRFSVQPTPDQSTLVMLLGEGEPSPELAAAAVDAWGLATQRRR